MKKSIVFFVCMLAATYSYSQNNIAVNKKTTVESIYTSLKPADGQGAVFNTKEELDAKVQDKKDKMIALIKENANDPVKVKAYREELWRFENAVVQTPKSK